jgi:hypothetical protein
MSTIDTTRTRGRIGVIAALALVMATASASAQTPPPQDPAPSLEIYGFAMLDFGQNFSQIHPSWFDTMRLTKLPKFEKEYGEDGSTFAGVRQSRLGVRSSTPTGLGDLTTIFEFELFGVGVDEGQTTFRLRHAYGELGAFGAGQYWSPFMDIDVFPNSLEYWGPTGMPLFRNVQVRWMPIKGDTRLTLALERPGASGDPGVLAGRIELQNVKGRFPAPDLSGEYRWGGSRGYVEVAGILRYMKWDDVLDDELDLAGSAVGWGVNLTSNIRFGSSDTLRLLGVVGEGIQNYMNDSPVDVGVVRTPGNARTPFEGKPIPITGFLAFLDHSWNSRLTTAVGYSAQFNDNTDGQAPDAFANGYYALGNVLYSPVPNAMVGVEFQWGKRENFNDGFSSDATKIQASFKYNFSAKIGG